MADPAELLDTSAIRLGVAASDQEAAIRLTGQALVDTGAVDAGYVDSMLEREKSVSTYVGEGVAIPHGTLSGKDSVNRDALSFIRLKEELDWGGFPVSICIGIAAKNDGHLDILAELAQILLDPDKAKALREASDADTVLTLLQPTGEDDD